MAVEPGLSEITSIQGDAALGAGANGLNLAVVQQDSSLPYLQAASVALAAVDKAKNDEYNNRLQKSLTNLSETDFSGLLPEDRKALTQNYAGLLKMYSDNFSIIGNPNRNPEKWSEIQQLTQKLRSDLQGAKDAKKVYDVSATELKTNPVWNTDTNRAKLENFTKEPIETRQMFQFDRPFTPDINTAAKAIGAASEVEVADSQVVPGGKYIRTTEGKTIDMEVAATNARNIIRGNDTFGRATAESYQILYDRLPEAEKSKYTDVEDFFVKNTLASLNRTSVTKNVLTPNQVYLQDDQQAFNADQNERDRALTRRGQDLQKEKQPDPLTLGSYKNEVVTRFIETGSGPMDVMQNVFGDNATIEVREKSVDPEDETKEVTTVIKKPRLEFLRSSIDSEGNRVVTLKDNTRNGRTIRKVITPSEANTAFNNILGSDQASKVADGSRKWLKSKIGKEQYDYDAVKSQFDVTANPAVGFRRNGADESPYKNRKFKINGKDTDNNVLLSNYSDSEIADFIEKGILTETK